MQMSSTWKGAAAKDLRSNRDNPSSGGAAGVRGDRAADEAALRGHPRHHVKRGIVELLKGFAVESQAAHFLLFHTDLLPEGSGRPDSRRGRAPGEIPASRRPLLFKVRLRGFAGRGASGAWDEASSKKDIPPAFNPGQEIQTTHKTILTALARPLIYRRASPDSPGTGRRNGDDLR